MTIEKTEVRVLDELGVVLEGVGADVAGTIEVTPQHWTPGTTSLRTSVVVAVADLVLGIPAIGAVAPLLPVTLDLGVELVDDLEGCTRLHVAASLVRAGRSVAVTRMSLADQSGRRVGVAHGSFFVPVGAVEGMMPTDEIIEHFSVPGPQLQVPIAERVRCERSAPGTALLELHADTSSFPGTLNGGLVAIAVEEAALSADPSARTITSMQLRYLRPIRTGPAVATAEIDGALADVQVRDGAGTLAVIATTRASLKP